MVTVGVHSNSGYSSISTGLRLRRGGVLAAAATVVAYRNEGVARPVLHLARLQLVRDGRAVGLERILDHVDLDAADCADELAEFSTAAHVEVMQGWLRHVHY